MKGFLKFLLLLVVEFVVAFISVTVLSLVVVLLSKIAIGRLMLAIINDGYVSEVVTFISNVVTFFVCALLADKINAYRPYRAVCIFAAIDAVYGIVSGVIHEENFIGCIIRLAVALYFFYQAREIDK